VVGPAGEKIYCDKYGRVKVQFHWDRLGKKNEASSCWVRVSQNWGGAKWGGMFIPHVGQEVIVEFEEGDPDRPLVTGRVYNAEIMPPLELPANKTQNIIRDHGGNQIVMEGDGGKQRITMFSPQGETTFSMGAPNSPVPGIYFNTMDQLRGMVNGLVEYFFGDDAAWEVKGNSVTNVFGNMFQHVRGFQEETCIGWKTEHTVGLHTDVAMIGKVEMMLGPKKEIDPIGHKKAAAEEQEKIARHDAKIAQVREDFGKVEQRIVSSMEKMAAATVIITGKLEEKIATEIKNVSGTLSESIGKLDQQVGGAFTQKAGSITMTSKAKIDLDGNSIHLTSKGTLKLRFSQMKANGGPVTMCDGALKVTP
jgi:hypothetical protein